MQSPRFRFTVRRLMIAVAVVATLLSGVELMRRSFAYSEVAQKHAWEIFGIEEELSPDDAEDWEYFWFLDSPEPRPRITRPKFSLPGRPDEVPSREERESPTIAAWRESQRRRIAFHELMFEKYQQAARYPWLPVPPDPSKPE